ncbi:TetR/AcrR family transcriptional regulator [Botrimarina mediterranea]|uniref:Bacterial regulatory protein, tetR family n=1 Tax=Botrimarina mediterranea TaxID=2528022 RepID=A0A518K4R9_9BACT|nr:TetR/AcrR family transcriptional regulator [Botrimarina mediterranea]QDV72790.1 Bacterial regulatory protein, tetR family [Botrimarina mediterranea]
MTIPFPTPTQLDDAPRPGESRKQREIRLREAQILAVARDQILEGGYLGLNMDRIAAQIEYSKGTIYQHFRNKEEILLALVNDALDTRQRMFKVAAAIQAPDRVRLATLGAAAEAFVEHFPYHFKVEQIVRAASIWEKTSPERRELMQSCEKLCMSTVVEVVHHGVATGDLSLPEGVRPEEIVFGLWSIYLGSQIITHSSDTLGEIGIDNPIRSLRTNQHRMLDGYGWRPLSSDYDYSAHMDRVKAEMFRHDQFAT